MREVRIVVEGSVDATGKLVAPSPTLAAMVAAFSEAIATHSLPNSAVKVVKAADLKEIDAEEILLCPFTLNLQQLLKTQNSKLLSIDTITKITPPL